MLFRSLFNNAIYLLPYTGVGSGITRALDEDINVTFMNNDKAQEFVITVWRGESNQVEDLDTGLRHSDTDLDTGLRHSDTNLDTGLRHSGTDLDTKRVTLTNKEKDIVNLKNCIYKLKREYSDERNKAAFLHLKKELFIILKIGRASCRERV